MTSIQADDVANYLAEHPEFFEAHAHLLADIHLPHPHGGRTIPLAERQLLAMRDKNRVMEDKLLELVEFGETNDAISEKVHALTLELLAARELDELISAVYAGLKLDFSVDDVSLRVFGVAPDGRAEFSPVSAELEAEVERLTAPSCGTPPPAESANWFGSLAHGSFATVPLRAGGAYRGVLILASADPQRFNREMGTLFLNRIGAMVCAALSRFLPAR